MLVIGSRGSQLALWQARWVQARLGELGHESRIEIIRTTGDKITDVPLAKVGSKGLFTKEIEEAHLDGRVDLAVHSLKDLPTELPRGLTIAAVPEREDPRDALIGKRLGELTAGQKVGTSSLRRAAQLQALRSDLVMESIRGNVDTRLRKLSEGQFDAIVLASAGLRRLGLADRIAESLPPEVMCPAVGQGALAIETRDDGGPAQSICAGLDHAPTRAAVEAERAVLASLGGGCQVPIGAHARVTAGELDLTAIVAAPDGSQIIRRSAAGPAGNARQIGHDLGMELLEHGARQILAAVLGPLPGAGSQPLTDRRVVITRARGQSEGLVERLRALGAETIELPVIEFLPPEDLGPLDAAVRDLACYDWLIFTSANGVRFFAERLSAAGRDAASIQAKVCSIGPATRKALLALGATVHLMGKEYVAESLVEAFREHDLNGKRILLARAAVARDLLPAELALMGARIDVVEAYRTVAPEGLAAAAALVFGGPRKPDWITFTSSSTVENFLGAVGAGTLAGVKVAAIGPVTSATVRKYGIEVDVEASPYTSDGLVEAILRKV